MIWWLLVYYSLTGAGVAVGRGGTEALSVLATGNAVFDAYDVTISRALGTAQIPRALWRVVKVIAYRESAAWRYAQRLHPDGVSTGMMGINIRYHAQVQPWNPLGWGAGQLTADPQANVEVGALLLLSQWRGAGGDLGLALERYARGSADAAGDYAASTLARMAEMWPNR